MNSVCLCCNKTHSVCKFGRHDQPDGHPCERHDWDMFVPTGCDCGTHEEVIDGIVVYYEKCR